MNRYTTQPPLEVVIACENISLIGEISLINEISLIREISLIDGLQKFHEPSGYLGIPGEPEAGGLDTVHRYLQRLIVPTEPLAIMVVPVSDDGHHVFKSSDPFTYEKRSCLSLVVLIGLENNQISRIDAGEVNRCR